jgi:hypothetical protein
MPDRLAEALILYIRKNNGALGRIRRENEFEKLTDSEAVLGKSSAKLLRGTRERKARCRPKSETKTTPKTLAPRYRAG